MDASHGGERGGAERKCQQTKAHILHFLVFSVPRVFRVDRRCFRIHMMYTMGMIHRNLNSQIFDRNAKFTTTHRLNVHRRNNRPTAAVAAATNGRRFRVTHVSAVACMFHIEFRLYDIMSRQQQQKQQRWRQRRQGNIIKKFLELLLGF